MPKGIIINKNYGMKLIANVMLVAAMLAAVSCGSGAASASSADTVEQEVNVPAFDADAAFADVRTQVEFGPRVPGTVAHGRCAEWLDSTLRAAGADTVIVQTATVSDRRGGSMPVRNIIGRFNVDAAKRILLLAHYDTRPWADEDPDAANHNKPIDGANDGASGVAVLTQMARCFAKNPLPSHLGVDLLFADSEDSGSEGVDESWCIGTQYFVQHLPYRPGKMPKAAVLLDMVGGKDAVFPREYFSSTRASALTERLWKTAAEAGYGSRFANNVGGAVNDDHIPLLDAGIPAVDIIEIGHPATNSFNPTWHTMADNIDNIDPATLAVVGNVVVRFVYTYK